MISNEFLLREAFAHGITPPPEMKIHEWADANRVLPSTASSEPGAWRTSRFPYTKEIMEELSPSSPTQEVVLMGGAQVAKTEVALNVIGFVADIAPSSMLYVLPTIDTVEKFSKQRLSPSIAACPPLQAKIVESKSKFRDADSNTMLVKSFPGGIMMLAGANSAAALRAMPIQWLLLDEVDSYVSNLQEEGDPVEIAKRRTSNFPRRKILYTSTPKIRETSRIEPLFESGDQRYYNIPCPYCGTFQVITWSRIKWEKGNPGTACLQCSDCDKLIEERFKTEMLENGYWKPTYPNREIASFHISSLYSPLGFYSWKMAATQWEKAQRDNSKEQTQVFINTVLGETYTLEGKNIDISEFTKTRKKRYEAPVPSDVLLLTAGVDVQDDRLECEIVGWGPNEETWSIDYNVLHGDTELEDVWKQLDLYLQAGFVHTSGTRMSPVITAIDSGHRAKVVYGFCSARLHRRVFAVKGREGFGSGFVRMLPRKDWKTRPFIAFVDEIKNKVYSLLRIQDAGPGYCHFPDKPKYSEDYFKGLTAETLTIRKIDGKPRFRWFLPKGRRNEPLDCRVLNVAAYNILNPPMDAIKATGKPYTLSTTLMTGAKKNRKQLSKGVEV